MIFHNCAPRKDDLSQRIENDGEFLAATILPNGSLCIGVFSGYSFSFFSDLKVFKLKCKTYGSQFRSRDIFPEYAVKVYSDFLSKGNFDSFVEHAVTPLNVPESAILYIDGYGNIKTNLIFESFLNSYISITINQITRTCLVSNSGIFSVQDGELILSYGSSGWNDVRFSEVVLRGGSAATFFNNPKPGDIVKIEMLSSL